MQTDNFVLRPRWEFRFSPSKKQPKLPCIAQLTSATVAGAFMVWFKQMSVAMNATDFSPHSLSTLAADWTAPSDEPVRLPERCTRRVCYAQKTTPGGEKTSGHFSMEAHALADSVWQQLARPEADEPHPSDLALHRWLADHDVHDDQVPALPEEWRGIEIAFGQLFAEGRARVFCTCCNHNFQRWEVRLGRSSLLAGGVPHRYFCPEGHLLFGTSASRSLVSAEKHAA